MGIIRKVPKIKVGNHVDEDKVKMMREESPNIEALWMAKKKLRPVEKSPALSAPALSSQMGLISAAMERQRMETGLDTASLYSPGSVISALGGGARRVGRRVNPPLLQTPRDPEFFVTREV